MGCKNCSNGNGLPAGCKNNGACGVSGCNKLEVFDWLAGMELPDGQKQYDVIEVRFKNSRKAFYRNSGNTEYFVGDVVVVESSPGYDVGVVSVTGELVRIQMRKKGVKDNLELRKIIRKANEEDLEKWQEARKKEKEVMLKSRQIAYRLGLVMKLSDVEYQGDGSKATFYYTADDRVDFRELIRELADAFKIRIEMRQIGSRQEAQRLGGIGSCGRELCCTTWLTDFRSVSTSAARYQQLALNPQKLAGQCGKLKCCLNYELDAYMEAVKEFPGQNTRLFTEKGSANLFKTDIFKRKLWFFYEDGEIGASPVCLDLETVHEIIALNKAGKKPGNLRDFEVVEEVEQEEFYANVVGQDSLTRFDEKKKKKKKRRKGSSGQKQGRNDKKAEGGNRSNKGGSPRSGGNKGGTGPGPKAKSSEQGGGSSQSGSQKKRSNRNRPPRKNKPGNNDKQSS